MPTCYGRWSEKQKLLLPLSVSLITYAWYCGPYAAAQMTVEMCMQDAFHTGCNPLFKFFLFFIFFYFFVRFFWIVSSFVKPRISNQSWGKPQTYASMPRASWSDLPCFAKITKNDLIPHTFGNRTTPTKIPNHFSNQSALLHNLPYPTLLPAFLPYLSTYTTSITSIY